MQGKYVANRIGQTIITLFAVFTMMWLLFRAVPGDPAALFISGRLPPEDIEILRKSWGLNAPLYIQYMKYMANLFRGNLGISFYYREPVTDIIIPRFVNTMILMGPTMIMAIIGGAFLGSHLGWKRGTTRETMGSILALFARSFPIYLSGIIALMLFSHLLGWFPLGGMRTIGRISSSWIGSFFDVTRHLVLPVAVAVLYFMGDLVVIARTSMLDLIGEEFLDFAKARGFTDSRVQKIAMRNAIIPVITYSTIMVGFAFGGQVLLELVFSWPGIGRLMVNSVERHDYPVAQAAFFIMAFAVITANLVIDLIYGYLDPRITYLRDR